MTYLVLDLDGTLSSKNTFREWLFFLMTRGLPFSFFGAGLRVRLIATMLARVFRLIKHSEMKFQVLHIWADFQSAHRVESDNLAEEFAERVVSSLQKNTLAFLKLVHEKNLNVILATAAPEVYVRFLAGILGIELSISTPCILNKGWRETLGPRKRQLVTALLAKQGVNSFVLMTDHSDDEPLCEVSKYTIWFGTLAQYQSMGPDAKKSADVLFPGDMMHSSMIDALEGIKKEG